MNPRSSSILMVGLACLGLLFASADWPRILLSWNDVAVVDSTVATEGEKVEFYVFLEGPEPGAKLNLVTCLFYWACQFELVDLSAVIPNPTFILPMSPYHSACMDTFIIQYNYCPELEALTLLARGTLNVSPLSEPGEPRFFHISLFDSPSWM